MYWMIPQLLQKGFMDPTNSFAEKVGHRSCTSPSHSKWGPWTLDFARSITQNRNPWILDSKQCHFRVTRAQMSHFLRVVHVPIHSREHWPWYHAHSLTENPWTWIMYPHSSTEAWYGPRSMRARVGLSNELNVVLGSVIYKLLSRVQNGTALRPDRLETLLNYLI